MTLRGGKPRFDADFNNLVLGRPGIPAPAEKPRAPHSKKNTQRLHNKKRKTRKKREGTSKSCVDDPSAILKIMSERMDPENNIFWELMSNNFIVEKTM